MTETYCLTCGPERTYGSTHCDCNPGDDCGGLFAHTVTCDRCGDCHASDDACGCEPCENCCCDRIACACRCCDRCGELNDLCGCFDNYVPLSKEDLRVAEAHAEEARQAEYAEADAAYRAWLGGFGPHDEV